MVCGVSRGDRAMRVALVATGTLYSPVPSLVASFTLTALIGCSVATDAGAPAPAVAVCAIAGAARALRIETNRILGTNLLPPWPKHIDETAIKSPRYLAIIKSNDNDFYLCLQLNVNLNVQALMFYDN